MMVAYIYTNPTRQPIALYSEQTDTDSLPTTQSGPDSQTARPFSDYPKRCIRRTIPVNLKIYAGYGLLGGRLKWFLYRFHILLRILPFRLFSKSQNKHEFSAIFVPNIPFPSLSLTNI